MPFILMSNVLSLSKVRKWFWLIYFALPTAFKLDQIYLLCVGLVNLHVLLVFGNFFFSFLNVSVFSFKLTGVAALVTVCACPSRLYEQQGS